MQNYFLLLTVYGTRDEKNIRVALEASTQMAAQASESDFLSQKLNNLSINQNDGNKTEAAQFYATRKQSHSINFARLEKGLLLFIYVYETTKIKVSIEMALWDHRLCYFVIKDGICNKPTTECHNEHESTYRQKDLCSYWYMRNNCNFGTKCKNSHEFKEISKYHSLVYTETDTKVYQLIRFIRNFAGHYVDSAITSLEDQQYLYREIMIVMVHLVHFLCRKNHDSIEHLNLFLEATTIKQMIPAQELLKELMKSYEIPDSFFKLYTDFNSQWYQRDAMKQIIDFNQLSPKFISYFNDIFTKYYDGRLKARGAKRAWNEEQENT